MSDLPVALQTPAMLGGLAAWAEAAVSRAAAIPAAAQPRLKIVNDIFSLLRHTCAIKSGLVRLIASWIHSFSLYHLFEPSGVIFATSSSLDF